MNDYTSDKRPDETAVQRLLQQTGWADKRSLAAIKVMLDNSINVCAWDGDILVGYGRAVSDGCCRAFVEDVVVDEAYRGQGIGGGVVQKLVDILDPIEQIVLNCIDEHVPFYAKYGFSKWGGGNRMHIWKGD